MSPLMVFRILSQVARSRAFHERSEAGQIQQKTRFLRDTGAVTGELRKERIRRLVGSLLMHDTVGKRLAVAVFKLGHARPDIK